MAEVLEGRTLFNAGDPDGSFGTNGRTTIIFKADNVPDVAEAVAMQPDGKVVVVGQSGGNGFAVARLTADGALDTSFAGTGKIVQPFGGTDDEATAVLIQADGKIVVAGRGQNGFALVRFNTDGALDTTFGTGGRQMTTFGADGTTTVRSLLDVSGEIVAVGTTGPAGDPGFALAMYDSNGAPEPAFGAGAGAVTTPSAGDVAGATVASDGAIVVVGRRSDKTLSLARYNLVGQVDLNFGPNGNGLVVTDAGFGRFVPNAVTTEGDSIVVAGRDARFEGDFGLVRFNADGTVDGTFGGGQLAATDFGTVSSAGGQVTVDEARAIAVQPDGNLIVAGTSNDRFALARYSPDGVLDTGFGTGGVQTATFTSPNFPDSTSSGAAVAIQPDPVTGFNILEAGTVPGGQFVLTGPDANKLSTHVAVARFLGTSVGPSNASISGLFYSDTNGNGTRDAGEPTVAGMTAYADKNDNAKADPDEPQAVSGADGTYTIKNLRAGTYRIRELRPDNLKRTQPAGNFPAGFYDVALATGQKATGNDFGNTSTTGGPVTTNQPPVAVDDGATTDQGKAVDIVVLANDADEDGTLVPGSVSVTTAPQHGTAAADPTSGHVLYTPAAGFSGADQFTYTVKDNKGATSGKATVNVRIKPGVSQPADGPDLTGVLTGKIPVAVIGGAKAKPSLSVKVTNAGNAIAAGTVRVSLFVSADTTLDPAADTLVTTASAKLKLKPGVGKSIKFKVGKFPAVPDNTYHLLAQVDSGNAVVERDETNNVATLPATLTIAAPFVDLRGMVTVAAGATVARGGKVTVPVAVQNAGNVTASGKPAVTLYASADNKFDASGDRAIITLPLKLKLKAGGSKTYKLKFVVPADLAPASYFVIAQLDSGGTVPEKDETNNVAVSGGAVNVT